MKDDALDLLINLHNIGENGFLTYMKKAAEYKEDLLFYYFDIMLMWFRDVLVFKTTKNGTSILFKEYITQISSISNKISYDGIDNIVTAIEHTKYRLNANVEFMITMQSLFLAIKENIS